MIVDFFSISKLNNQRNGVKFMGFPLKRGTSKKFVSSLEEEEEFIFSLES